MIFLTPLYWGVYFFYIFDNTLYKERFYRLDNIYIIKNSMFTKKEIKALMYLYRFFKGEHRLFKQIFEKLTDEGFNKKDSFELAFMYDKNFVKARDGNFSSIPNPIRISFEDYTENIPTGVKAVMEITDDYDFDNYEVDEVDDEKIKHDGVIYRIFYDESEINTIVKENSDLSWLCENLDPVISRNYVDMSSEDRHTYAWEEATNRVDNMDRDEIIDLSGYSDSLDEVDEEENRTLNKMGIMGERISQLEKELEELDRESEDYSDRWDDLNDVIDDLKSQLDDLLEIDYDEKRTEIYDNARASVIDDLYDSLYDELSDPINYFILNNGIYNSLDELIDNGIVTFNCDGYISDYLDELSGDDLLNLAGYEYGQEIHTKDTGRRNQSVWVGWND